MQLERILSQNQYQDLTTHFEHYELPNLSTSIFSFNDEYMQRRIQEIVKGYTIETHNHNKTLKLIDLETNLPTMRVDYKGPGEGYPHIHYGVDEQHNGLRPGDESTEIFGSILSGGNTGLPTADWSQHIEIPKVEVPKETTQLDTPRFYGYGVTRFDPDSISSLRTVELDFNYIKTFAS